ncbi:hypothetical protein [Legionella shakespearei]|uniref:Uncharacterized protein n=1 Tax=Legionella shakespearei DSM 23087 TaxID=1122169 RepID=A0A0W0Z1W1_9GAMM|nr:hypothetical protein [Legionella shakespearei]KTD63099.1 hypothetical protein Lsha_0785 [Legionella shakespearei DSM 23087]
MFNLCIFKVPGTDYSLNIDLRKISLNLAGLSRLALPTLALTGQAFAQQTNPIIDFTTTEGNHFSLVLSPVYEDFSDTIVFMQTASKACGIDEFHFRQKLPNVMPLYTPIAVKEPVYPEVIFAACATELLDPKFVQCFLKEFEQFPRPMRLTNSNDKSLTEKLTVDYAFVTAGLAVLGIFGTAVACLPHPKTSEDDTETADIETGLKNQRA